MDAIDLNNLKVFRGKLVDFSGGQIANATVNNKSENFTWDGLALLKRDATTYLNEPVVADMIGLLYAGDTGEAYSLSGAYRVNNAKISITQYE